MSTRRSVMLILCILNSTGIIKLIPALADGEAIKVVNEAAEKYFVGNAQLLKKLETVSEALRDNSKIIVPSDSNLVNVIGDLAGDIVPINRP